MCRRCTRLASWGVTWPWTGCVWEFHLERLVPPALLHSKSCFPHCVGGGEVVIVLKSCVAFQNQLSLEGLKQFKCDRVLQLLFFGHRSVVRKQDGGALVLCHVNLERNRSLLTVILYLGKKKKKSLVLCYLTLERNRSFCRQQYTIFQ